MRGCGITSFCPSAESDDPTECHGAAAPWPQLRQSLNNARAKKAAIGVRGAMRGVN